MLLVILVASTAIFTTNYLTRFIDIPKDNMQDNIAPDSLDYMHMRESGHSSPCKSDSSQTPKPSGDR